ncbi:MAG: hypothetical protein JNK76_26000 [Planctomycetales bacterium]|nr:hypothetical protein [Planctomycetales bacterium]MBN8627163.1 hypothetical protein [Planctomycetota bacterium]
MEAYCLPLDSPYFALTDNNGKFEIADLPAGEDLEISIWHERYGFISPDGKQDRVPLTLKLTAHETREVEPIKLARPVDEKDSGR